LSTNCEYASSVGDVPDIAGRNRRKDVNKRPTTMSQLLHRGGGGGAGPLVRFEDRGSFGRTGLVRWKRSQCIGRLPVSDDDRVSHRSHIGASELHGRLGRMRFRFVA
jgi:hypothetical protein